MRSRHQHRRAVAHAEQLDGHVDRADVDEPAGLELIPVEPLAIGAQRRLTIDAAHQVAPVGRRCDLLRRRLEVEDIESECRLFEITLLKRLRQAGHEREERTRGSELQERATIGHARDYTSA